MRGLTRSQRLALDLSRSVAVSAGAGTGKTRVLAERFLRAIEDAADPRVALDEVVAITFTEKAAEEMRGRVRTALFSRASENPTWGSLLGQIDQARISTIHGFCTRLLREHALSGGLDPDFRILSGADAALLLEEVVSDFLSARAAGVDADLETLAEIWSRGQVDSALRSLFARRSSARSWANDMGGVTDAQLIARWRARSRLDAAILGDVIERHAEELQVIAGAGADDPVIPAARLTLAARTAREIERAFASLLRAFLDKEGRALRRFHRANAPWKAAARRLAPTLRDLGEDAFTVLPALDEQAPRYLRALARLWLAAVAAYGERKEADAALDLDDLEERTDRLLAEVPAVCSQVRSRVRALLVDEVQDLSELQGQILWRIASGEDERLRPRVLCAVGDAKQSIYRFRGAEVTVFDRIQAAVAAANERSEEAPGRLPPGEDPVVLASESERRGLVSLQDNLRTLDGPLRFINQLFSAVFGDASQDFEARPQSLRAARTDPHERVREGVELLFAAPPRAAEIPEEDFVVSLGEAELVAAYLASGRWCQEGQGERPAWSDCAILMRRRQSLKLFEDALRRRGIPFAVIGGIGFYQAQEVLDLMGLLGFLADERSDGELATVLRSPLAAFPDDLLYAVATTGAGSLWTRLGRFARRLTGAHPEQVERAATVHARLESWRRLADRIPLSDLMARALEESGAYSAMAHGPRGAQRLANVEKLLELARLFEAQTGLGLARFIDRLRTLGRIEQREGEADVASGVGGVRLLTIHAAKGLEFPLVIVPELGMPLPAQSQVIAVEPLPDGAEGTVLEVGLLLPDPDAGYAPRPTGLRRMVRATGRSKEIAEAKRLLYVACTRARDRLVLVGTPSAREDTWHAWLADHLGFDQNAPAPGELRGEDGRPLARILDRRKLGAGPVPLAEAPVEASAGPPEADRVSALRAELAPLEVPRRRLRLWPSVAKSLRDCVVKGYFSGRGLPEFPQAPWDEDGDGNEGSSRDAALVRGSIIHRLFEVRAWERPDVEALALSLAREAGLGPGAVRDDILGVALRALSRFPGTSLGRRLANAAEVHVELPFTLAMRFAEVSGKIDLLFRDSDGWCLVDYKTDIVGRDGVGRRTDDRHYGAQLALYAAAAREWAGEDELGGGLYFTAPAIYHPVPLSRDDVAQQVDWLEEQARLLLAGMPPAPDRPPCRSCGYAPQRVCPYAP